MNERIKELSGQLQLSEIKCTDMKEDLERVKRELSKAENVEIELRKTSENQSKTITEYHILKEQVINCCNIFHKSQLMILFPSFASIDFFFCNFTNFCLNFDFKGKKNEIFR